MSKDLQDARVRELDAAVQALLMAADNARLAHALSTPHVSKLTMVTGKQPAITKPQVVAGLSAKVANEIMTVLVKHGIITMPAPGNAEAPKPE